eukprot:Phypoly_transcript_03520.p1 GENE.Phypoly_transcript_03520~~Phypoly_transcript_03520.p1  ORF type:complete len:693 (+),score=141.32 Phypoly_transcript_03520:98-2080(+)
MAGVESPLDTTNGTLKVNTVALNGKDPQRKRGSSFSLSYFDEDDEGSVEKEEPSKPPLPAIAEKKESPQITPAHSVSPPPAVVEEQENESTPQEEEEKEEIEEEVPAKGREELMCLFTPDSFPHLKELALEGKLNNTSLRGVTWRVLLGVLSTDTSMWADQIQKHRAKFVKIRDTHVIDPHQKAPVDSELDKFNPLSQHEENPWNQYFQNAELQKEITHDVLRTYQGNPFFDKASTKEILTQLLFLYAKENSSTRYIQGMNELLAPILYVLNSEKVKCSESPSIFDIVSDEKYLVHDTYTLFSHLLKIVGRWFAPLKSGNSPVQSKKDALLEEKLYFGTGQADESTNLQIVQQCRHIHYNLLNEVEPHLSRYLRDLQIEPHLYMLRWVRILLTQVFALPDVLIIWDGIFAFGNNAVLLDWLCVAMLVTIRHLVLGQDYSRCMQLLFNYPQDQDVRVLVKTALTLYTKFQQQRQISPAKSSSSNLSAPKPTTNTVTVKPATSAKPIPPKPSATTPQAPRSSPPVLRERAPSPPKDPQYPQLFQEPLPRAPAPPSAPQKQKSILQQIFSPDGSVVSAGNEEAQYLRNTAAHMANRLERVLFLLGSLQSTPESEETVKLASEEVAQVRAILHEASEYKQHAERVREDPEHRPPQAVPAKAMKK